MHKYTIRAFLSTKDGYQFIHKTVDIPEETFAAMQAWSMSQRAKLIEIKQTGNDGLWAGVYDSFNALLKEHHALSVAPDGEHITAHFFALCIDNPELIAVPVPVHSRESVGV